MKSNLKILLAITGLAGIVFFACSKKSVDEVEKDKLMFGGSARYRGTVYFKNVLKGTNDTAKNATLKIYKGTDASKYYSLTLTNGTFDLTGLSGGNYTIEASYYGTLPSSISKISYQKTFTVSIPKDILSDNQVLLIDEGVPATATLQLMVKDQSGSPVTGAQVCLYTDLLSMSKYQNTCNASVKSVVTNSMGIAAFTDLANTKYYATAYVAINGDTTSNKSTALTVNYGPYTGALLDQKDVTITPDKSVLSVTVTDQNGANISGAQVCVYSDLGLITKYNYKCTGSLRSSTTDINGLSVFKNMQAISYYISASKVIGKDTLSNILTQTTIVPALSATTGNKVIVAIK